MNSKEIKPCSNPIINNLIFSQNSTGDANNMRSDINENQNSFITSKPVQANIHSSSFTSSKYNSKTSFSCSEIIFNGQRQKLPPISPSILIQIQNNPQAWEQFINMDISNKTKFIKAAELLTQPGSSLSDGNSIDDQLLFLLGEGKMEVFYELQEKGCFVDQDGTTDDMRTELLETFHQYFFQYGSGPFYDNRHHNIVYKLSKTDT